MVLALVTLGVYQGTSETEAKADADAENRLAYGLERASPRPIGERNRAGLRLPEELD
jgi:hypothetical protein